MPANIFAAIHTALGEKDAAFEWAQKAVDRRDPWISHVQIDPVFEPLRSDPRYTALLRKMNLA
jgi:hypothetical protein